MNAIVFCVAGDFVVVDVVAVVVVPAREEGGASPAGEEGIGETGNAISFGSLLLFSSPSSVCPASFCSPASCPPDGEAGAASDCPGTVKESFFSGITVFSAAPAEAVEGEIEEAGDGQA